jgi:hypothetical protein
MKRIDEQLDTMDREESLHPMVRQTYEGRCPSAGGFRPTMWRMARELGLSGEVLNDGEGAPRRPLVFHGKRRLEL